MLKPLLTAGVLLVTTFAAEAQNRRMPAMFGDDAPKIGDTLPDVTVFNADGKPVSLRGLEGKYRVLVFGCLT